MDINKYTPNNNDCIGSLILGDTLLQTKDKIIKHYENSLFMLELSDEVEKNTSF